MSRIKMSRIKIGGDPWNLGGGAPSSVSVKRSGQNKNERNKNEQNKNWLGLRWWGTLKAKCKEVQQNKNAE